MSSFLYAVMSLSLQCSVRREISPCTCSPHDYLQDTMYVTCERVESFNQVVDALQYRFKSDVNIWLKITESQLDDMETRKFTDMQMNIKNLRLNNNQLRFVPESSFLNLTSTQYLSLAGNTFEEIPRHIFPHMNSLATADFSKGQLKAIYKEDFAQLAQLRHLVLVNNKITMLERDSIPKKVVTLHLGRNNITSLNGTIRGLNDLEVLFINHNELTTLDDELPTANLLMILVQNNRLERLPASFKLLPKLDSVYLSDNQIRSFDGVFQNSKKLVGLFAIHNKIEYLAQDEFKEVVNIETLDLSYNYIKSLNKSLQPMINLTVANLSYNLIEEFSFDEIRGFLRLHTLDLSHNRIKTLKSGSDTVIYQLKLDHNLITTLDGGLAGLPQLNTLTMAHNQLTEIGQNDLTGLNELEVLDLSHNNINALDQNNHISLPKLKTLYMSYNNLTILEHDFHGLPSLCYADLSNNYIHTMLAELVSKTKCINHKVHNRLEIILQENPILCQNNVGELLKQMEAQQTNLIGLSHCYVPKEDVTVVSDSIVIQSQIPLISNLMNSPGSVATSVLHQTPTIVQVIVPADVKKKQEIPAVTKEPVEVPEVIQPVSTTTMASTVSTAIPEIPITATELNIPEDPELPPEVESEIAFVPHPDTKLESDERIDSVPSPPVIYEKIAAPIPIRAQSNRNDIDDPLIDDVKNSQELISGTSELDNNVQDTFSQSMLIHPPQVIPSALERVQPAINDDPSDKEPLQQDESETPIEPLPSPVAK